MRPLWGVSCLHLFADGQSRASTTMNATTHCLFFYWFVAGAGPLNKTWVLLLFCSRNLDNFNLRKQGKRSTPEVRPHWVLFDDFAKAVVYGLSFVALSAIWKSPIRLLNWSDSQSLQHGAIRAFKKGLHIYWFVRRLRRVEHRPWTSRLHALLCEWNCWNILQHLQKESFSFWRSIFCRWHQRTKQEFKQIQTPYIQCNASVRRPSMSRVFYGKSSKSHRRSKE